MSIMHMDKPQKTQFISEEEIQTELEQLEQDTAHKTTPYPTDEPEYADKMIPFVKKHTEYLKTHPKVNPKNYLANLRAMTKIRE